MQKLFLCLCLACLLASCATRSYDELGRDIKQMEITLRHNNQMLAEMERRMAALPKDTSSLKQNLADLQALVNQLKDNLERMQRQMRQQDVYGDRSGMQGRDEAPTIRQRVGNMDVRVPKDGDSEDVSIIQPEHGADTSQEPAVPEPAPGRVDPQRGEALNALYKTAYEDYLYGIYTVSITGFQRYIKQAGSTNALSVEALYWIGECYLKLDQGNEAVSYFKQYLDKALGLKTAEERVPEAYFGLILAYDKLGLVNKARYYKGKLEKEFPNHELNKRVPIE